MSNPLPPDVSAEFAGLTPAQQGEVLAFIHQLKNDPQRAGRRDALLTLAGSISAQDAAVMRRVIAEECERIDAHE